MTRLTRLAEGQPLVYGGDQVTVVSAAAGRAPSPPAIAW